MKSRIESNDDGKLTTAGAVVVGGTLTAAAVATLILAGHHSEQAKSDARIARNEAVISHATTLLDGVVYLKDGVHVRQSMKIDNGDSNRSDPHPSNIRFTAGEGKYKGKTIVVIRPLVETDTNGKEWIAFDDPGVKATKLRDRAANLGYVAIDDIMSQSPASIVVNPYKESTSPATVVPVDYMDIGDGVGGFENAGTGEQMQYAMTATAPEDHGK